MNAKLRVGIVGARGYTGAELARLLEGHPALALAFSGSRELTPEAVAATEVEAVVLALPDGQGAPFVEAIDRTRPGTVIVDLSADHRFDDRWYYGLPELTRARAPGQRRISNPGCYATGMQLAIAPLVDLLEGPPVCFGVSGYSGAGSRPSERNDPALLRDNLMPYRLVGHVHEREVSRQLGRPVEFLPHVASHFRGIVLSVNLHLAAPASLEALAARYRDRYEREPLITILDEAPWVSRIAGRHGVELGGLALSPEGTRAVVVVTLDNLLKGAATQALQNLNLALELPELAGISHGSGA